MPKKEKVKVYQTFWAPMSLLHHRLAEWQKLCFLPLRQPWKCETLGRLVERTAARCLGGFCACAVHEELGAQNVRTWSLKYLLNVKKKRGGMHVVVFVPPSRNFWINFMTQVHVHTAAGSTHMGPIKIGCSGNILKTFTMHHTNGFSKSGWKVVVT